MDKLYDHIPAAPVVKRHEELKRGDVAAALKSPVCAPGRGEYEWRVQSHASMGPACALADVKAGSCTVWTGSQKPHFVRGRCAKLLALPRTRSCNLDHGPRLPTAGTIAGDAALDAAIFRATGKRARTRHAHGRYGLGSEAPACVHRARERLSMPRAR